MPNKKKNKENKDLAIEVKDVSKSFTVYYDRANSFKERVLFLGRNKKKEKREILKDINWEIKEGENWALIGLNGSGKSTLLSMIPAYTFATKGEVSVFDKKFGTCVWAEIKEKVGFVSSTLNNFSDRLNNQSLIDIVLSGKYNSIGIYQEITQKDREKSNNIIRDFKLSHLKLNKFGTLSQGEQRKTLLARAFMNSPSLLILDEPCSGLDIRAREIFLKSLEENSVESPANWELMDFSSSFFASDRLAPESSKTCL